MNRPSMARCSSAKSSEATLSGASPESSTAVSRRTHSRRTASASIQSCFDSEAGMAFPADHSAVSPHRLTACSAYPSGSENSPKTSNFSSGVNALPIAFASIARSTDATILFSCSIRSVSSSRWRFR
jgi:hypothetical protein